MTTKNFMKRVMPLALAFLMVLSTVLVPMNAKAATKPVGLKQYIMVPGEQWGAPTYYVDEDASISYKIAKKKVATVDAEGVVTAKKKGKCKLVTTVKQGGKTYKIKTQITVKNDLTWHDAVNRANGEFAVYYQICFDTAYANGWVFDDGSVADETYGAWLKTYHQMVVGVQDVIANPDKYSDEDLQTIYTYMEELVAGVPEAYAFFSVPNEG